MKAIMKEIRSRLITKCGKSHVKRVNRYEDAYFRAHLSTHPIYVIICRLFVYWVYKKYNLLYNLPSHATEWWQNIYLYVYFIPSIIIKNKINTRIFNFAPRYTFGTEVCVSSGIIRDQSYGESRHEDKAGYNSWAYMRR
jgi:hypothetical protein